ncbi:hypothetical protein V5799_012227 [Amblyomma americanum]|uniref:Serpin domain-containing protein n=1 Tax=Amblyomma americanum TaxID=6943 RepID=A0AAQ4EEM4_AMBAM
MVELPYENPSNAMIILLPTGPGGLATLEEKLSTPLVLRAIDRLREAGDVELSLPKFRIRQVTNLTELLPLLGVIDAFTDEARLDCLTPAAGVRLSDIRHVATLHVSEAGGRPPSSNDSREAGTSPAKRKVVAVDRPFMFLVLNRRPDLVLLMGSVNTVV